MPPVPVYTSSPINAAKASGVTPQTETPDPTPASRYAPAQPTPTQQLPSDGPPPPQPGAIPRLPTATATASTLPPPPKAGEAYRPPAPPEPTAAPRYPPLPPQMGMPTPVAGYRQQGTATSTAPSQTMPGYIPGAAGGYQQNSSSYQAGYHENVPTREEDGVWGSAMKWAQAAGKKLSEAESEVWKRINGDGK
ncbi:hypothetical protein OQA88_349 [Cercophora sp. LCS_1]